MVPGSHFLSPDTQAVLLLCGALHEGGQDAARPLSPSEYNRLAQWLRNAGLRPADLLTGDGEARLSSFVDEKISLDRLERLLKRGALLGLQVESWTNQGLWIVSRSDADYPDRLRERLKHLSPPLLYGVGRSELLNDGGLAIVGSRAADARALDFTERVAIRCAREGIQVLSGGAKGIDAAAMYAALKAGGIAVGILADSLARMSLAGEVRAALSEDKMVLVSPYAPHVGFNVGNAMGRNKLIYALSDWALVISSEANKGGTWAGATENLKHGWASLFVRMEDKVPSGNQQLLAQGALALQPAYVDEEEIGLKAILDRLGTEKHKDQPLALQPGLFVESDTPQTQTPKEVSFARPESPLQTINPDEFWSKIIWPLLYHLALRLEVLNRDSVMKELGVKQGQADEWLMRAVEKGRMVRKIRPVRYLLSDDIGDA